MTNPGVEVAIPPRRRPGRRWRRRLVRSVALGVGLAALVFASLWILFPYPGDRILTVPHGRRVVDRGGRTLRLVPGRDGNFRLPVPLARVSPLLIQATLAVEDRRFRSHWGIDPLANVRAVAQNISNRRVVSGASTLTQQLVRILDQRPRTLVSKAVEAFRALQLEAALSKDDILAAYLNLAPYGGNLYGVEATSLRYFGKSADSLDLAEASLLAGLPQSPSRFRPDRYLERALRRRSTVLEAMERSGYITAAERAATDREIPRIFPRAWPLEAFHLTEVALRAEAVVSGPPGPERSATVRSSLDQGVQRLAERRLKRLLDDLPGRADGLSGAAVVLDAATNEVLALVGSPWAAEQDRAGFVNCALRPRSSGSTLKPFLYALAFDRGIAAPDCLLPDTQLSFAGFSPENFDHDFLGPLPAGTALALSRNVPAVWLLEKVGVERLLDVARISGLRLLSFPASHYGLSLAIGGGEVSLLDLANAYAGLVGGGKIRPWTVLLFPGAALPPTVEVFSQGAAGLTLQCLSTEQHLARAAPSLASRWAGALGYKTGTSFGLRDAWAVAFSRSRVVGIWIGDPAGRPHPELVGVGVAAPLALELAAELEGAPRLLDLGAGDTTLRSVCPVSGYPCSPFCPQARVGASPRRARRLPVCAIHRELLLDATRDLEVCDSCRGGRATRLQVREVWPPELGIRSGVPHDPGCRRLARVESPRILSPAPRSELRLLEGVPFDQSIALTARAAGAVRTLFWFVDGVLVGSAGVEQALGWKLTPGTHDVRCVDDRGRGDSVQICVR